MPQQRNKAETRIQNAISYITDNPSTKIRAVSRQFNVPYSTL